ncbi:MAG TPA: hypothetical protein VFX12_09630 [Vicinamibacterales bacterium]|nr:hypothetical protein [Vicinamibacterales bacterium]
MLKVCTNVPDAWMPLLNEPSSAVTECGNGPVHVNVMDSPAVIVVVDEFGFAPS